MTELKSCPFCSGTKVRLKVTALSRGGDEPSERVAVGCDECSCLGTSFWPPQAELRAIAAWNRRAGAPDAVCASPREEPSDELVMGLREEASDPRFDTSNFHCDLMARAADEIERRSRGECICVKCGRRQEGSRGDDIAF